MDMLLKGKRALITGSTSEIGAQCARVLAGEGVSVVINGRSADRAAAVTEEIRKVGGEAKFVLGDVTTEDGMPKAPVTNITFGTMTLGYRGYGARVHDAATADAMLGAVLEFGHDQLDTCSVYGDGTCEQMLGDLRAAERFSIATRISFRKHSRPRSF